ncbi:hypothetical protein FOL47_003357 [Perkinsus chesapeaki]|uniref:Aquaporin-9 n=1 Tax=Perkinsus chesapeaki TaxID=330153 RepID=A0A7J6M9Y9_PERCH|nr:hypothetical protein FOL47_003357 [Perkinsus chesapeaki]
MIPLFAITIMALFTVGSLGHDVSNEMPGSLTDYPASFSVPVNCSITKQVEKVPYCLTGVLDPLRKWIVFDLYMFDVDHPEKTVLFGVILTLHNGSVEGMIPRAGGCAAPVYVQLKPPQIRAATTICTSTNIISAATFGNTTYFNGSTATHVADAFKVPVESSVISVAQVKVDVVGNYLALSIGWACGLVFGILASVRISGAHLNPAVSLALCVSKLMPWRNLLPYIGSQILGAFIGAAITFLCYYQEMEVKDLSNAGVFATYPRPGTNAFNQIVNEMVGTALLTTAIAAVIHSKDKAPANRFHIAGFVGLALLAIGLCFGANTGYAINPARDFGPRLFTALAGWGPQVFTADNYYFWVPIVGPMLGGTIGITLQRLTLL